MKRLRAYRRPSSRRIRSRRWHQSLRRQHRRLTRPSASARGRSSSSSEATSRARTICVCARGGRAALDGGREFELLSSSSAAPTGRATSSTRSPAASNHSAAPRNRAKRQRRGSLGRLPARAVHRVPVAPRGLRSPRRGVARLRHAGDHVASRQHRRDRGRRRCFLVDPYDVAAIETAMDRLLDDDALLERPARRRAAKDVHLGGLCGLCVGFLVNRLRDTADATGRRLVELASARPESLPWWPQRGGATRSSHRTPAGRSHGPKEHGDPGRPRDGRCGRRSATGRSGDRHCQLVRGTAGPGLPRKRPQPMLVRPRLLRPERVRPPEPCPQAGNGRRRRWRQRGSVFALRRAARRCRRPGNRSGAQLARAPALARQPSPERDRKHDRARGLSVPRKAPSSWRSRRRATRARTPSGRGWPTRISRR